MHENFTFVVGLSPKPVFSLMRNSLLAALSLLSLPAVAQQPSNLLNIPGAESTLTPNWTVASEGQSACSGAANWRVAAGGGINSHSGSALFFPGCNSSVGGMYSVNQVIDVSADQADIAAGLGQYSFDGFYASRNEVVPDEIHIWFAFLDQTSNVIGMEDLLAGGISTFHGASGTDGLQSAWSYMSHTMTLPPGTNSVQVNIQAFHNSGSEVDTYMDDMAFVKGGQPLALGLTRFTAAPTPAGAVSLVWEDSRTSENSGYDAQWSTDGKNWKTVGHVAATRGTSFSYSCLHHTPARGTNYYRVAAISRDGSLEYGSTVVVNMNGDITAAAPATVWPVPASDAINIGGLHAGLAGTAATLLDAQGRVVRSIALGTEASTRLSLQGCAPGFYSLRLADGQVLRVVKD